MPGWDRMRDLSTYVEESRAMLARNISVEAVLGWLRQNGCEVIESIKVLKEATDMDLATAKSTVHLSKAWSDRFGDHEAFHDLIEEVAREESL